MNLRDKPFYLSEESIKWVLDTLKSMSIEEKIGQLFCPIGYSTDPRYLDSLINKGIGGLFFRDGDSQEMHNTFAYSQQKSKIPLLIPSNIESGGDGAAIDGTPYGKPMSIAATDNPEFAYHLGKISCSEAKALGINWAFAPIVDIDLSFRNPITNIRTFGNNADKIISYATEYMKAANEENVLVTLKHFPGDGVDERDQHILTSINSLSIEEWDASFGKIYQNLIDKAAPTVMVGHIALPSYQKHFSNTNKVIPASLSKELLQDLLRNKLNFNGLIITDATPMLGFTSAKRRSEAVPLSIEYGCDMFLFNKDFEEDYEYMMKGYENGLLSINRIDEAITRILALKAKLKLHEKKKENTLIPSVEELKIVGCEEHHNLTKDLADKSITLVKDTQNLLPISSENYKRILLQILGDFSSNDRVLNTVKAELENNGFEVSLYEKEDFNKGVDNVETFKSKYDLVIYLGNVENASNKTTNRINWYTFFGQGNNAPWFTEEVKTLFISVANPYHLFDVPMIKTYINCYSNNDYFLKAAVSKILGFSEFNGKSPIDPFCGLEELEY